MSLIKSKKPVLWLVLLSSVVLFIYVSVHFKSVVAPNEVAPTPAPPIQKEIFISPDRLTIPNLDINTGIEHIGLTEDGEMDVPSTSVSVGWFKLGSIPGKKGSAVIAGHVTAENGDPGIFANLSTLKLGDIVNIHDANGTTLAFRVTGSRVYDPGYAEEVFSKNDGVYLNLVTCEGDWDTFRNTYLKRLVVTTELVAQESDLSTDK